MLASDRCAPPSGSVFHELRPASLLPNRMLGRSVLDLFPHSPLHCPWKNGPSRHPSSSGIQHLRQPTVCCSPRSYQIIPSHVNLQQHSATFELGQGPRHLVHRLHPFHSLRHFRVCHLPLPEENDDEKQAEKAGKDAGQREGEQRRSYPATRRLLGQSKEDFHDP